MDTTCYCLKMSDECPLTALHLCRTLRTCLAAISHNPFEICFEYWRILSEAIYWILKINSYIYRSFTTNYFNKAKID